jgi:hypothetical protein
MTIYLTEDQIRAITWTHVSSELSDANVRPAVIDTFEAADGETIEMEEEPAVSEAYGTSELRGIAPDGTELTLNVEWCTSGNTKGDFEDLYRWYEPEVNRQAPEFPVHFEQDVKLLDEDGDEDSPHVLADLLADIADEIDTEWMEPAMRELPSCPEGENIDIDEGSDMETITIERDNEPALRFTGEKIAEVSSRHFEGPRSSRWTELTLYRTAKGRLICEQVGKSLWVGESNRRKAAIADNADEVLAFFGFGWLAKDLYDAAGIDAAQDIDTRATKTDNRRESGMKKVGEKNDERTIESKGGLPLTSTLWADTIGGVSSSERDIDDLREYAEFENGEGFYAALPYCADGQVLICRNVDQHWFDVIRNEYGLR